ncbi:porin [Halomonas campisalis]|uniref:Porin n=1 Tax=Billgrantia campisalis TaxID=74661 RepID=A0ABS9PA64_9GAMM|nr:porin [Halomonas campisalis]MCG6658647.1 porin [Halomonas campisalis]MDR5864087.1 porin [Halomonas campisalis]
MKKTLLATAVAGAMAFTGTAVQAATVYDQDGTQLNIGGRVALGVSNNVDTLANTDTGSQFRNVYSRLNINGSSQIDPDLRGFFEVEWRFNGAVRDTSSGFQEVRTSLMGVESQTFGTLMAGNFGGLYNSQVLIPFDVYLDRGYEMTGHPFNSRGNSVAYLTPNLEGFQAFIQGKHFSSNDNIGLDSSKVRSQGGVTYDVAGLRLAAGWAEPEPLEVTGNLSNKTRYGATARYAFNDMFSGRLGIDAQRDVFDGDGQDVYGLGGTVSLGQLAFNADYYYVDTPDGVSSRNAFAAGAYYRLNQNVNVFTEFNEGDDDRSTYVLAGARYMF